MVTTRNKSDYANTDHQLKDCTKAEMKEDTKTICACFMEGIVHLSNMDTHAFATNKGSGMTILDYEG